MQDWLLVPIEAVAGFILGAALLIGAFHFATRPRRPGRRSWFAPPSGRTDTYEATTLLTHPTSPDV